MNALFSDITILESDSCPRDLSAPESYITPENGHFIAELGNCNNDQAVDSCPLGEIYSRVAQKI